MSVMLFIGLTLLLFLYLLINRVANQHISANARYIAGLVLLIAFLVPYQFSLVNIPMPAWMETAQENEMTITVDIQKENHLAEISEIGALAFDDVIKSPKLSLWQIIATGIYVSGVAVFLFLTVKKHLALRKICKRVCVSPSEDLQWQFDMLCGKMEFRRKPKLLICRSAVASSLGAPFTFGIFQHKVVIPDDVYGEEAEMLMEHELYHCKRSDSIFRLLLVTASIVYWFYLPMYVFVRTLFSVCEESCDARMTENQNSEYRAAYGKLLIRYASKGTALPVSFSSTGKKLKQRIEMLFTAKSRHEGYTLICVTVCVLMLLMGTSFSAPANRKVLEKGSQCFEIVQAESWDDGIFAMSDELFHAFSQFNRLNQLSLCRDITKTGDLTYSQSDDLYYTENLIATVMTESRDGTEFSAVSIYCDERLAETCVGIRLTYDGERKEDGSMAYTKIRILSDQKLLDYYVWLLLPEGERGDTFENLPPMYNQEKGWEEKVLRMAYEKDPGIVPFYRALIARVSSS